MRFGRLACGGYALNEIATFEAAGEAPECFGRTEFLFQYTVAL